MYKREKELERKSERYKEGEKIQRDREQRECQLVEEIDREKERAIQR